MKAKRFLMMVTLLLMVAGVSAQKIDQRLTRLVEKSDTRSGNNRITQNPQAVKRQIAVVSMPTARLVLCRPSPR